MLDHLKAQASTNVHCFPVILKDTIVLEAGSDYIIRGFSSAAKERDYLFVPDQSNLQRREILSAECVIHNQRSGLPIRVLNVSDDSKKLFQNTRLGWLTQLAIESDAAVSQADLLCSMKANFKSQSDFLQKVKIGDTEEGCTESLKKLLWEFSDVFSESKRDLGCSGIKHEIITNDHPPIALKQRRIPLALEAEVDQQVKQMLDDGIIRESTSPWSFPLVVVRKPNGDLRLCVDYRKLNEITRRPIYPIPESRTIFDTLEGNKYFTSLDLSSGYHQVPMEETDKSKTAFSTRRGQFEFNRMPFGLCGAPATFQRIMNVILKGQVWEKCVIYLDDVLIFGRSIEEHNERLKEVLQQFRKSGMKLSPHKCVFLRKEVRYLGHVISEKGISTDPEKVKSIMQWPVPKCVGEVHSFVGLCNYYRSFIQNFSQIVEPLQRIVASKKFVWSVEQEESFAQLKNVLTNAPILSLPRKKGKFILDTDASHSAIGAILSQVQDGEEKVIAYASNKFTKTQRSYCITRKELLAAYHYIKHFKHYLAGKQFTLRTDHKAIVWLLNWKKPNTSQYCLWKADLECFSFDIEHRKGSNHCNVDSLSRSLICEQCEQCELSHPDPKKRRNVKHINEQYLEKASVEENVILATSVHDEMSMVSIQLRDRDSQMIKMWLKNGMIEMFEPEGYEKLTLFGKSLWLVRRNLRIRGDVLYHVDDDNQQYRFVAVPCMWDAVMNEFHDEFGHFGIHKCYSLIRARYFWPHMKRTVSEYISRCTLCAHFKEKNGRQFAPVQHITSSKPFERICIDICGPLERTRNDNKYVLGIIDHFSKYIVLVPLRSVDAKTVARSIWKEWITKFGCPQILFSDSGKVFESELIIELCKECKIKKMFSPPYHQQANGLIERLFKTIKPILIITSNQQKQCWDEVLPTIECAVRASVQTSVGYSPFEIIYGTQIRLPWEIKEQGGNRMTNVKDYIEIKELYRAMVKETVNRKQKLNENILMKNRKKYNTTKIGKGDIVLIKNRMKRSFTDPRYIGPCVIVEQKGEYGFLVKNKLNGKLYTRHYDDIKKLTRPDSTNKKSISATSMWSIKRNSISSKQKCQGNVSAEEERSPNCHHEDPSLAPESNANEVPNRRYPQRVRKPVIRFGMTRGEC